ncbi:MAG: trimethylamine methyltransferase family protein [Actinomycetia bacterium]|nr:trimethylamine methyltransferase family protein [Actinomycetes bacterium]MCP4958169.1 trimethylamine methyltransferase family protein [Actinomycetes bacterium]
MTDISKPRRRGRGARKLARETAATPRLPTIRYGIKPVEVVSADQLETIHQASLKILREVGIDFRDEVAIEQWSAAGAEVRGERVHLDGEMIEDLVARAPERFELTGRGPNSRFEIGLDTVAFCPTHGPPNIRDLEGVRRFSTIDDLRTVNKIVQMSPGFHMASGFAAEPMDIAVPWRHLHINHSSLVETDLATFGMTTGEERTRDSIAMAEIVYGSDFLRDNVVMLGHISGNSPLVWDSTMLEGLRVMIEAGQGVLISPFVLGAANTPADVAATAAQLNAEALACIAYSQLVHPGAPVIYGQYSVAVSMKSGAPMSGMPEVSLLNGIVGQLARRYKVPWRTSAAQSSGKTFDAQSGYESATSYMAGVTANANLMLHAGGWDEAGMVTCLAKLVADSEQNLMMATYARGVSFDRFDEALEAVGRIGPGGHYLGDEFTLANFEDAFFSPKILDYEAFETWELQGLRDMWERSRQHAQAVLASYEPPPMDDAVREELDAFVERRQSELSPDVV